MKRFLIFLTAMIYTFVSLGGSVYIHQCSGQTSYSIYESTTHDSCPLCTKIHDNHCEDGNCESKEVKIDQLSEKAVSSNYISAPVLSPAIITKYWLLYSPEFFEFIFSQNSSEFQYIYTNSSPPTFIFNCTFRI